MVSVKTTPFKIGLTFLSIFLFLGIAGYTWITTTSTSTQFGSLVYALIGIFALFVIPTIIRFQKNKGMLFFLSLLVIGFSVAMFYAINATTESLQQSSLIFSYIAIGVSLLFFLISVIFGGKS